MVVYNVNGRHCPQMRWLKVEDTRRVVNNIFLSLSKKKTVVFLAKFVARHKSVTNGLLTTLICG